MNKKKLKKILIGIIIIIVIIGFFMFIISFLINTGITNEKSSEIDRNKEMQEIKNVEKELKNILNE